MNNVAQPRFIVIYGDTSGGGGSLSDFDYSGYFDMIGDWFKQLGDRLYEMAEWWERYIEVFARPFEAASSLCYKIAYRFYVADDEVERFRKGVRDVRYNVGELLGKMLNVENYLVDLNYWLGEIQSFKDTIGARIVSTINDDYLDRWLNKRGESLINIFAGQFEAVLDRVFR